MRVGGELLHPFGRGGVQEGRPAPRQPAQRGRLEDKGCGFNGLARGQGCRPPLRLRLRPPCAPHTVPLPLTDALAVPCCTPGRYALRDPLSVASTPATIPSATPIRNAASWGIENSEQSEGNHLS